MRSPYLSVVNEPWGFVHIYLPATKLRKSNVSVILSTGGVCGRQTPPTHPPIQDGHCKRTVRILLECILVIAIGYVDFSSMFAVRHSPCVRLQVNNTVLIVNGISLHFGSDVAFRFCPNINGALSVYLTVGALTTVRSLSVIVAGIIVQQTVEFFHKLAATLEYQYCQLRFSCTIRNNNSQNNQWGLQSWNINTKLAIIPTCEEQQQTVMLAVKRPAGVAPEVNLRECTSHTPPPSANKAAHFCLKTQKEISPEVQNRGINGPTKRTDVLQISF